VGVKSRGARRRRHGHKPDAWRTGLVVGTAVCKNQTKWFQFISTPLTRSTKALMGEKNSLFDSLSSVALGVRSYRDNGYTGESSGGSMSSMA
jgi:hypothetical protein